MSKEHTNTDNEMNIAIDTTSIDNAINTKCGFIAIIGRPNVGKSTLINHLIGDKVSITSRKPQTTQYKINGITVQNNIQYVFVDTPGFQNRYVSPVNELLNQSVVSAVSDIDAILFVVEAGMFNPGDDEVLSLLKHIDANSNRNNNPEQSSLKIILVINKIDKMKDKLLLTQFAKFISHKYPFIATILLSAKNNFQLDGVFTTLAPLMPISPFLYLEDQLTDKDNNFLIKEIIREKLFRYLGQELPYSIAVIINEFIQAKTTNNEDISNIDATILVEKDNQKMIIIGKNGEKLKKISSEARLDCEKLLDQKVFLRLWVKVKTGFGTEKTFLEQFKS